MHLHKNTFFCMKNPSGCFPFANIKHLHLIKDVYSLQLVPNNPLQVIENVFLYSSLLCAVVVKRNFSTQKNNILFQIGSLIKLVEWLKQWTNQTIGFTNRSDAFQVAPPEIHIHELVKPYLPIFHINYYAHKQFDDLTKIVQSKFWTIFEHQACRWHENFEKKKISTNCSRMCLIVFVLNFLCCCIVFGEGRADLWYFFLGHSLCRCW